MIDVGVVGLGLIGGSIAMNLSQGLNVAGYDTDPRALELACQKKAIAYPLSNLKQFENAKLIFVAAPPRLVPDIVESLLSVVSDQAVITDCASVKGPIFAQFSNKNPQNFVGGHPMAGKERGGFENARADLFENASWVLTPACYTSPRALEFMIETVQTFGARPLVMSPEEHDQAVALVSHLPHVLASIMVQLASKDGSEKVGGGAWEGLTRVAASDPNLWAEIIIANSDAVGASVEVLLNNLRELQVLLEAKDKARILDFFEDGQRIKMKDINNK